MPLPTDTFTLYLRGEDGARLRKVLEPFGAGGDLDRWKLSPWDAEVIHSGGAQVALIRVSYGNDPGSVRQLIYELHEAARKAGVVLSDDVNSEKSAGELIKAFGIEGERTDVIRAGKPSARWSTSKKVTIWIVGAIMIAIAYAAVQALSAIGQAFLQGR